ncbi:MAG: hypothetical protein JXN62_11745 [Bacteroidales bacterium]|nr:hypothetical protein [Bacteroidales bacterium]
MNAVKKYILSIDQSTAATKAMLFDRRAKLLNKSSVPHKQFYPRPGFVEHDPEEIITNTLTAIRITNPDGGGYRKNQQKGRIVIKGHPFNSSALRNFVASSASHLRLPVVSSGEQRAELTSSSSSR